MARDLYDFGDGRGPVPAYRHKNGGGWVEISSVVSSDVYVDENATICGMLSIISDGGLRVAAGARITPKKIEGFTPKNPIPFVPDIDLKLLEAIEANRTSFDMGSWHSSLDEDINVRINAHTNHCCTTHCRAGWAIHLAGKAGYELEKEVGPWMAGALIYQNSRPGVPIPSFYGRDENAIADIRLHADQQRAQKLKREIEEQDRSKLPRGGWF